jgi:hypothetical protein
MLFGVRVQVKPAGDTEDVRATVPVNPLVGATVIVEVAAAPAVVVTAVGLALRAKPPVGEKVTVAVCDRAPLVPVTVTVKVVAVVEEQERVEV